MKQIHLRYRLIVFALIGIGLFLITLSAFCFGQRAEDNKGPAADERGEQLIPISKLQIPVESAQKAEMKSQAFLKFFKTPTQQLMPLAFSGMAHDMRNVQVLARLRRHGINLFLKFHSEQSLKNALGDLKSAREAGVAILQNFPRRYFFTRGRKFWQQHISGLVSSDQILVWYLPAEIKAENLDKLEMINNIIRATDSKNRPIITYVVKWREDYLKQINSMVDALVFGFYPCHNGVRPRIEIKRRIDHAHKCGVPIVLAALEAFEGKHRWPSPEEIRFDAYLALISGAKGIMWYAYAHAKQRPDVLEAILHLATELNGSEQLGEVLLLGNEPESLICRTINGPHCWHEDYKYGTSKKKSTEIHSIQWMAREYEGSLYIFAVNSAQKTIRPLVIDPNTNAGPEYEVTVSFGPINSDSSEVQVISENRGIELADGHFVDTFESLETHLYKVNIK